MSPTQPPVAELNGAAAVAGIRFGVRDLHDGGALLVEFAEEFHDLFGLGGMQVARRLVGEQATVVCE